MHLDSEASGFWRSAVCPKMKTKGTDMDKEKTLMDSWTCASCPEVLGLVVCVVCVSVFLWYPSVLGPRTSLQQELIRLV